MGNARTLRNPGFGWLGVGSIPPIIVESGQGNGAYRLIAYSTTAPMYGGPVSCTQGISSVRTCRN